MDKLKDIKEGDRVRVTFECILDSKAGLGAARFKPVGSHIGNTFIAEEINRPTFTIEKLPEPLKAGDRVKWDHLVTKTVLELEGEIITTYQDTAWVKADRRDLPYSVEISRLTKIS